MTERKIGTVTHYYNHLHVAGVIITDGELHTGDRRHRHRGHRPCQGTRHGLPRKLSRKDGEPGRTGRRTPAVKALILNAATGRPGDFGRVQGFLERSVILVNQPAQLGYHLVEQLAPDAQ